MTNKENEKLKADQLEKRVEKWELPNWDQWGNLIEPAVEQEEAVETEVVPQLKYPTAAELEQLRQDAIKEGRVEGHQQGFQQGIEEGRETGNKTGYEEGFAQGKEQGHQDGYQQGLDQAAAELEQLRMTFADLLLQMDEHVNREQDEVEAALVSILIQLCRSLIQDEFDKSPQLIKAIVRKAIAALPEASERLRIQVNPNHLDVIKEMAEQSKGDWQVETDASLTQGGCIIKTGVSIIDFSLEHRFKSQLAAIVEEAGIRPEQFIRMMELPALVSDPELPFDEVRSMPETNYQADSEQNPVPSTSTSEQDQKLQSSLTAADDDDSDGLADVTEQKSENDPNESVVNKNAPGLKSTLARAHQTETNHDSDREKPAATTNHGTASGQTEEPDS